MRRYRQRKLSLIKKLANFKCKSEIWRVIRQVLTSNFEKLIQDMKLCFSRLNLKKKTAICLNRFKELSMNLKRRFNHKSRP